MKKLLLIDSHALIHRAYHALPPLTSPTGEPTNAVYGFASILLRAFRELKPDYIAAAFDLPGPTFRHIAYERYKAQRPKTPDDLSGQFNKAREILQAFGIPVFQKEGYEADDIIGTIAKKLEKNKIIEILVVTGDMDALQFIRPNLKIYTLKKGVSETAIYDEKAVIERYGIKPDQMADYKGLRGDASDNIPGVKGIGEKTASELIKNFGSIDKIYSALKNKKASAGKISASIVQKLLAGEEDAKFSRELARIKTNVPLEFELSDTAWHDGAQNARIAAVFLKFGFSSLIKRMNGAGSAKTVSDKTRIAQGTLGYENAEEKRAEDVAQTNTTSAQIQMPGKNILSDFLLKEVESPLTEILREMETRGVLIDRVFLVGLSDKIGKKIRRIESEIYEMANELFNINSTRELSMVLFDKLGISIQGLRKTEKNKVISTSASELEKLKDKHPIVNKILEYRESAKLKNTYIDTLPDLADKKDGRIHTTFDQFGASTGRLSSSNPNLQNIPILSEDGREIRKAFIAAPGFCLASFDYSQIELRVAAHIAEDKKMIEAFKRGEDIHNITAAEINNMALEEITPELRRAAKTMNFGILYGMGPQGLAEAAGISYADAKKFIQEYFHDFAGIKNYIENTKKFVEENGYVETIFGRRRYIPEIYSGNWRIRREAERMAINMPIQGTATGDIVKMAMVKTDRWIKKEKLEEKVKMLLQVHDELVFEIRKEILPKISPQIKKIMENAAELKVPLVVEAKAGHNWGEQTRIE